MARELEVTSCMAGVAEAPLAWSYCMRLLLCWAAAHLLSSVPTLALDVACAPALSSSPHTSPTATFDCCISTLASNEWNPSPLCVPWLATTLPCSSLPPWRGWCPSLEEGDAGIQLLVSDLLGLKVPQWP